MDSVRIKYLGHSCFRLSFRGTDIVLDPYADGYVPGLDRIREEAHFVFCSHGHRDHGAASDVTVMAGGERNFGLEELTVPHDDAEGAKRGQNTLRIFNFGGIRVAHLGDIGRTLTHAEAEKLRGLDAMLIPVGGYYTIDAAQAREIVERTAPRVVIPMHYSGEGYGYDEIASWKAFVEEMGEEKLRYGGSELTLSADTPAQVCIMRPALLSGDLRQACLEYHAQGYNCCQCVLKALGEYSGLGHGAANIGFGFGGGMQMKSVCGALTGALMSIGAACLDAEMPNPCRPDARALSLEMERRFAERFGTMLCGEILEGNDKSICGECIAAAAEMAEDIIREYKTK